jgi:SAM-dependent methyltransferase
MLYHVPDRARASREFARVLKPCGQLFATTNGEEHMAEIPMLIAAFNLLNGDILPAWPKLGFTLESGKSELERYFAQVERYPAQRGVMRITEARRWLPASPRWARPTRQPRQNYWPMWRP